MNKVKIITDTACDLTMDYLAAQGIGVVPMTINFPAGRSGLPCLLREWV